MAAKDTNLPAKQDNKAKLNNLKDLLSKDDLANLAGFFDVLIEMDFESKLREQQKEEFNDE
jgi:hypothetical protein